MQRPRVLIDVERLRQPNSGLGQVALHDRLCAVFLLWRHVSYKAVEELCQRPECVGVGETGLDYFKEFSPRKEQLENSLK